MIKTQGDLEELAEIGLKEVMGLPRVREAEVFASSNEVDTTKDDLETDVPCGVVHQPSCMKTEGVGVRLFTNDGLYGFGFESSLGKTAVVNAAKKALDGAYPKPLVQHLPNCTSDKPKTTNYHDLRILEAGGTESVDFGYRCADGVIEVYRREGFTAEDNLALSGDVTTVREGIGIRSSRGIVGGDTSTLMWAYLTSMIQKRNSKGTGWATGGRIDTFSPEEAGRMAASNAVRSIGGQRIPKSGKHNVVFGPQAVTDLVHHFLQAVFNAAAVGVGHTPISGVYGKQAISSLLNVYDDGSLPGLAATKGINCEGLPTERTDLIKEGVLVGFLSDQETAQTWNGDFENDATKMYREKLRKMLGTTDIPILRGRNGFRFGRGGGRQYMGEPSVEATNLFLEGTNPIPEQALLEAIGDGLYIGTLWYTYPVHGINAGDVTSTAIANSYIVKGGKIVSPLLPNTVRIEDNFPRMFNNLLAVGDKVRTALVWGIESMVNTPEIAIRDVNLSDIAQYMSASKAA